MRRASPGSGPDLALAFLLGLLQLGKIEVAQKPPLDASVHLLVWTEEDRHLFKLTQREEWDQGPCPGAGFSWWRWGCTPPAPAREGALRARALGLDGTGSWRCPQAHGPCSRGPYRPGSPLLPTLSPVMPASSGERGSPSGEGLGASLPSSASWSQGCLWAPTLPSVKWKQSQGRGRHHSAPGARPSPRS